MKYYNLLKLLLLISLCVSCAVDDDDDDNNNSSEAPASNTQDDFSITASTNENGIALVNFSIAPGVNKFSIVARPSRSSSSIRFTELRDSDGTDYIQSGSNSLSLADNFGTFAKTATIPSRSNDPAADNNRSYSASIQAIDQNNSTLAGETITVRIAGRADSDLESGGLNLNIFFVGEAGGSEETQTAVRNSFDTVRSTFSNAGIGALRINEFNIDGPINIPSPLDGSSIYSSASGMAPNPSVNIFIGGSIGGTGAGGGVLGFAADIPGNPFPSERSVTAVSIFESAGPDGVFSEQDTRLLGETIAHEAGHFMGLFHPIDFAGNNVQFNDPLDDTASCSSINECLNNSDLIRNFMYPNPVLDQSGNFVSQNVITSNQRSVLNRYFAVD